MIAIIDSGVANLTSVRAACERLNATVCVTADPAAIQSADRVILPGVGTASAAMRALADKGLIDIIRHLRQPVLGICLGMQILFAESEESDQANQTTRCLGVIPGDVCKMPARDDRPIPHMGWNSITLAKPHPLTEGLPSDPFMYFVHSYAAPVGEATIATCSYTQDFTSVCAHANFMGCQFHPERSGEMGNRLLNNFLNQVTA